MEGVYNRAPQECRTSLERFNQINKKSNTGQKNQVFLKFNANFVSKRRVYVFFL